MMQPSCRGPWIWREEAEQQRQLAAHRWPNKRFSRQDCVQNLNLKPLLSILTRITSGGRGHVPQLQPVRPRPQRRLARVCLWYRVAAAPLRVTRGGVHRYLKQSPAFRAFCQWLYMKGSSSSSSSSSSEVQMLAVKEDASIEFHTQRLQWAR
jgi:hypothetical protein